MTAAALDRVFARLKEAEEHVLKARRIIMGLMMDLPFDFEHQADAFLKDTDERAVAAAVIAHDNEENAQRGEPKTWTEIPTDDTSGEWAERLFCMEEGIRAYLAAIPQPQAGEAVASGYGEFTPIQVGCSTASPQPASQARVTDAMVEAAVTAYNTCWPGGLANREQMRAALTAAIGAGGQAVAVKPLEWKEDHSCLWEAGNLYHIEDNGSNWKEDRYWLYIVSQRTKHPTLEAAKAAAQADYETRIRSVLVASPPPSGEVEALGRFGHHPDPAIDFEVEVGAIEAQLIDTKAGPFDQLKDRIFHAMAFNVGGDEISIRAKQSLREMEKEVSSLSTAPATADGWRTMEGPVPTYECEFHVGQPVKMANPYAGDDPSRVFYVTGIRWEYRMGIGHGWDITIASKDEIEKRHGATYGFAPSDLNAAAPTATGGR